MSDDYKAVDPEVLPPANVVDYMKGFHKAVQQDFNKMNRKMRDLAFMLLLTQMFTFFLFVVTVIVAVSK